MNFHIKLIGIKRGTECVCSCGDVHHRFSEIKHYIDVVPNSYSDIAERVGIRNTVFGGPPAGITTAVQLTAPLEKALRHLRFGEIDPLVSAREAAEFDGFLARLLEASIAHPEARVEVLER